MVFVKYGERLVKPSMQNVCAHVCTLLYIWPPKIFFVGTVCKTHSCNVLYCHRDEDVTDDIKEELQKGKGFMDNEMRQTAHLFRYV